MAVSTPALVGADDPAISKYVTDNTSVVDAGENVVVVNTPKDVYVNVYEQTYEQKFITNSGGANVSGANGAVQFNSNGSLGSDTSFTFDTGSRTVATLGIRTDNLLRANGSPWVFGTGASGANYQVQFNLGGNLAASANLQFNDAGGGILSVNGRASVSGNITTTGGQFNGSAVGLTNIPGSNVVGTVASATVATSANSVALANVVGAGNIAAVNLNGNSAQFLDGTGSWSAGGGLPSTMNVNSSVYVAVGPYQMLWVTFAGATVINLPAAPVAGTTIIVKDYLGSARTGNAITVSSGTNTIDGVNTQWIIDEAWNTVSFVAVSPTQWAII